jgi:hypothetical protein
VHRPQVLHDFDPGVVFGLEPLDAVTVTTLLDNVTDNFMPDRGRPAGARSGHPPGSRRPGRPGADGTLHALTAPRREITVAFWSSAPELSFVWRRIELDFER